MLSKKKGSGQAILTLSRKSGCMTINTKASIDLQIKNKVRINFGYQPENGKWFLVFPDKKDFSGFEFSTYKRVKSSKNDLSLKSSCKAMVNMIADTFLVKANTFRLIVDVTQPTPQEGVMTYPLIILK